MEEEDFIELGFLIFIVFLSDVVIIRKKRGVYQRFCMHAIVASRILVNICVIFVCQNFQYKIFLKLLLIIKSVVQVAMLLCPIYSRDKWLH